MEKQYEKYYINVNFEDMLENDLSGSEQIFCPNWLKNEEKLEKMQKYLNKTNCSYQKVKKSLLNSKRTIKSLQRMPVSRQSFIKIKENYFL